jgi:hypothetical protein
MWQRVGFAESAFYLFPFISMLRIPAGHLVYMSLPYRGDGLIEPTKSEKRSAERHATTGR